MVTSDDDKDVDGDGATSNEVDDDGDGATGDKDSNGDNDGDGTMGIGATGYDNDDNGRTIAAKRHHTVGRRRPMPPPNEDAPLPSPDALPKQHCTPKIIGMMCA